MSREPIQARNEKRIIIPNKNFRMKPFQQCRDDIDAGGRGVGHPLGLSQTLDSIEAPEMHLRTHRPESAGFNDWDQDPRPRRGAEAMAAKKDALACLVASFQDE